MLIRYDFDNKLFLNTSIYQCFNKLYLCYGTCNMKKNDCDFAFFKCFNQFKPNSFLLDTFNFVFKEVSNIIIDIIKRFGCTSYLKAQENQCVC
jgi:hypothetical protein